MKLNIKGTQFDRYENAGETKRKINFTYIPLTVLRAAGPKQVKVMLVQFIDPVDNHLSVLFVFYYLLNNKEKLIKYDICLEWSSFGLPAK